MREVIRNKLRSANQRVSFAMAQLSRTLLRHYLPKLLLRGCGDYIRRSGQEGEAVNCFGINVDDNGSPFFWVRGMVGDELQGLKWNESSFSVPTSMNLENIDPRNFSFIHFYGLTEVQYSGIFRLAIGRTTGWPYIKIHAHRILTRLDQSLFNKKKLVRKKRMELLKVLIGRHLDGEARISGFQVMTELYSNKWVLHPDADAQRRMVDFLLRLISGIWRVADEPGSSVFSLGSVGTNH